MTPASIIEEATRDGVLLVLSDDGKGIKATGKHDVVTDWLPIIRLYKVGLLQWLKAHTDRLADNCPLVRCCDCQHFRLDSIGSGQGIGNCTMGQTTSQKALLWPRVQRKCREWLRA